MLRPRLRSTFNWNDAALNANRTGGIAFRNVTFMARFAGEICLPSPCERIATPDDLSDERLHRWVWNFPTLFPFIPMSIHLNWIKPPFNPAANFKAGDTSPCCNETLGNVPSMTRLPREISACPLSFRFISCNDWSLVWDNRFGHAQPSTVDLG